MVNSNDIRTQNPKRINHEIAPTVIYDESEDSSPSYFEEDLKINQSFKKTSLVDDVFLVEQQQQQQRQHGTTMTDDNRQSNYVQFDSSTSSNSQSQNENPFCEIMGEVSSTTSSRMSCSSSLMSDTSDDDDDDDDDHVVEDDDENFDGVVTRHRIDTFDATFERRTSYIQSLPEVTAYPEDEGNGDDQDASTLIEIPTLVPIDDDYNKEQQQQEEENEFFYGLNGVIVDTDLITYQRRRSSAFGENNDNVCHRPSAISFTIFKETEETQLGVSLQSINGTLKIKNIVPGGLVSEYSTLQIGDNLVAINGCNCSKWNPKHAIQKLKSCSGMVTMLVHASAAAATTTTTVSQSGKSNNSLTYPNKKKVIIDPILKQAILCKTTPTSKLGISLTERYGRICISKLHSDGLILMGSHGDGSGTAIAEGDYIVSINDVDCLGKSPTFARNMISSEPHIVNLIVATSTKSTINISSRNVTLSQRRNSFGSSSSSMISSSSPVDEGSVVSTSDITVTATDLFSMSTTDNENHDNNGGHYLSNVRPAFYSVMVIKPTLETRLGIQLREDQDGAVTIYKLFADGLLGSSPLREGYTLLSINSQSCTDVLGGATGSIQYLKQCTGDIHFIAQDTVNGNPCYVHAMTQKFDPNGMVGIGFSSSIDASSCFSTPLKVSAIHLDGLFSTSVLNVGDYVLSINGIPSRHLNPSEAVQLVKQQDDSLSIVAQCNPSCGAVLYQFDKRKARQVKRKKAKRQLRKPNPNRIR